MPHALDRFRIATHRPAPQTADQAADRLINQLAKLQLDLGVLTGDYMLRNRALATACPALPPRLNCGRQTQAWWYGVFGNHDKSELIEKLQLLPINWLQDEAMHFQTNLSRSSG